jgi:hypothetical protein
VLRVRWGAVLRGCLLEKQVVVCGADLEALSCACLLLTAEGGALLRPLRW